MSNFLLLFGAIFTLEGLLGPIWPHDPPRAPQPLFFGGCGPSIWVEFSTQQPDNQTTHQPNSPHPNSLHPPSAGRLLAGGTGIYTRVDLCISMHIALWIRSCSDLAVGLSVGGLSFVFYHVFCLVSCLCLTAHSSDLTCLGGRPVWEADLSGKLTCLEG